METTKLTQRPKRATPPPQLVKILSVDPYRITSLWTNGETRVNDFTSKIKGKWKNDEWLGQLADTDKFNSVIIDHGVYRWPAIMVEIKDAHPSVEPIQPLDYDPILAYQESTLVESFDIKPRLASWLKTLREQAGLTQEQLAARLGYPKTYISKIERGVTDVQTGTLVWILEAGLGKRVDLV